MKVYGLTGGIASGKSTVSAMFLELGIPNVDADRISREIMMPGQPAYDELKARFGSAIIDGEGAIARKALGAIVFADAKARRDLEQITHPHIKRTSKATFDKLAERGARCALYEAALLVETKSYRDFDGLIVVSVPRDLQVTRLMNRDGLTRQEAGQRIDAQLPLAKKIKAADYVIDNSKGRPFTQDQVSALAPILAER